MAWNVLIAHGPGEETLAERLAEPIRLAGYEVTHRGTVDIGESIELGTTVALESGGPVVLCGTQRSVGSRWAWKLVDAARSTEGRQRVFVVQMEREAYVEPLARDGMIARYWEDPHTALKDLIDSLRKHYPLEPAPGQPAPPGTSQPLIPFQSPPRSDRYVERVQLQDRLKAALLPQDGSHQPPLTIAVLHGTGGIGKTSFATAFAHDPDVRRAYPDGVLWVSLGQRPNLKELQWVWGRALEDAKAGNQGYPDLVTGTSQLRTLLRDRACLLVVDDAWHGVDVESAFLVGGPKCLLLVTTRQAEVAQKLKAEVFELEGMAEEEALALFERWSGPLPEMDRATARGLAKQVDYLPLALELIGAQVGRIGGWSEYKTRWESQRLTTLKRGRRASGRDDNLLDSLELSVNALSEADRVAYLEIGVFPQGEAFPASAAAALWDVSESEAVELLLDFADQALATLRELTGKRRYVLHALLHDYVVASSGPDGVVCAHRALIAGYHKRCPNGWSRATDDGYLFNNLSYHLAAAGDTHELYALVERPWMLAQFARSESHRPFAQDVERALQAADAERPRNWRMLARCHYAIASLHSQASDMPEPLLEALVRTGRTGRALEATTLVPDPWKRARAYRKVGEILLDVGAQDDATEAFRHAYETIGLDRSISGAYVGEWLAGLAEGLHRCGLAAEAIDLLRRADAALQSQPALMNRCGNWTALAQAHAKIEGQAAATSVAQGWLEEIEAASLDDAVYAVPSLAQVLAAVGGAETELFTRLSKKAVYLRQQGRGEWGLAMVIVALADCGSLVQATDLLQKVPRDSSYYLEAAAACARAAHQAGNRTLTENTLVELYDLVEQRAAKDERTGMDVLGPLRQLVVEVQGSTGLERLARALTPYRDPIWRSLAFSQLAIAAHALGDVSVAAQHAAEASRLLVQALQEGPLHAEAVRMDIALSLAEAHQREDAMIIAEGISDREYHQKTLCRLALKLLEQGDAQRAGALLDRALNESAVLAKLDVSEVSAAIRTAEALSSLGKSIEALQMLETAREQVPSIQYETDQTLALVRLAEGWNALGEGDKSREALRSAFANITMEASYYWEESYAGRAFKLAGGLYNENEFEAALQLLEDNWYRRRCVLSGVVQGLVTRGESGRAQQFYDSVREQEQDFLPWYEVPKVESLAELARLGDEKILEWLQDGVVLIDRALRIELMGRVTEAWARMERLEQTQAVFQSLLESAAQNLDDEVFQKKLAEISHALASAGAAELARRAVETIPAGANRDNALHAVALALVEAGHYADAVAVAGMVQDEAQRDQGFTEAAEQLAEVGEYELALACARQVSSMNVVPYITATAARGLAIDGRLEEARAILKQLDLSADTVGYDILALSLARKAQALALLGETTQASACATSALTWTWAIRGAHLRAWCAEAFARLGETEQAAEAAKQALEAALDFDDDWARAAQLEVAAAALAESETLDGEHLLALVSELGDEFARADALGKLYPHLRSAAPDASQALYSTLGQMKDDWAKAKAVAALAERMALYDDRKGLHELLSFSQAIENKWAAAYALGRLASALVAAGTPDDLTQALKSMAGYELPGWRRAAALAMVASAQRQAGALDQAADLADEALKVARQQEDLDLKSRINYTLQCALAAFHLGSPSVVEYEADLAQAFAARIHSKYYRNNYVDPLFDLASELRAPERIAPVLALLREGEDRSLALRATSEAAVRLARMGHHPAALEHLTRALGGIEDLSAEDAVTIHSDAACVYHLCSDADRAAEHLAAGLRMPVSRALLAKILETNVDLLTSIDQGATLASIFSSFREVDAWWPT